jgi:hypothetical protein
MRIEILRDAKGEIIAMSQAALSGEVPVTAEVEDGQEVVEMDVPARYIAVPAADLIKQVQEDFRAGAEMIKAKK